MWSNEDIVDPMLSFPTLITGASLLGLLPWIFLTWVMGHVVLD